jgi:hypothetical protein
MPGLFFRAHRDSVRGGKTRITQGGSIDPRGSLSALCPAALNACW